jgi:hypothetical protein
VNHFVGSRFIDMSEWPRWAVMWLIAGGLFAGLKLLSWITVRVTAPAWKHFAYLLAWPGMDAAAFLTRPGRKATTREWAFAIVKTAFGLTFFVTAANLDSATPALAVGWLAMAGIIFTLHFGLFHMLSCFWRFVGCDAKPIMDWPAKSQSLAEFWGKRWNLAFRDLTHRYLFRPLTKRFGVAGATAVGFVVSGLVHELAITVPAGGGYGGPTAYFLIQLAGLLIERTKAGTRIKGRLFTAACLLLPAYWLFPPAFVGGIVVPFVQFVGEVT